MQLRYLVLGTLALGAVPVVALGGGGGRQPGGDSVQLADVPRELRAHCERVARRKAFRVLCPRLLPVPAGGDLRPGSPLCRPRRTYLVEYHREPGDPVGHVLAGGAARPFRLAGRRPGDEWLEPDGAPAVLGIPGGRRPARVIARARVHGRPALVLAAPSHPAAGVHGGHVLVVWNEAGNGYLVSLHGRPSGVARAALAVAESTRQAGSEPARPASSPPGGGPRLVAGIALGRSARGRTIRGTRAGDPAAPRRIAVFGCIHGDECAAIAVLDRLDGICPSGAFDLLLVPNLNPDGLALDTRLNGRGVDLNRNFPAGWRRIGRRGDPQHSGPRPLSEPESRLAARLIEDFRPTVTIWFHQQAEPLVRAYGGSVGAARRYARLARLPFHRLPWLAGTAPNWQNHAFPGTSSFVVELPFGRLAGRDAARHAGAILRLAERG